MEKSDQLVALATSLATDVEEFRSGMRVPEQQPHYLLDMQGASQPFSHSFTTHAIFNTYSPLHYDGDGRDIPCSPTKEGDEPLMQYDGDVQGIPFYPPNEIDQPPMQTDEEPMMDVDGMEKNSCDKVDTTLIYKRRSGMEG